MRSAVAVHPVGLMFYYRPVIKTERVKPEKFIGVPCSLALHLCLLLTGGMVLSSRLNMRLIKDCQ